MDNYSYRSLYKTVMINEMPYSVEIYYKIGTSMEKLIGTTLTNENADLIIKSLNEHEELVKALQDILNDWSERMHNETEEFKPENEHRPGYWSPASSLVSSKTIAAARAALKKVTDTPIEKQPK